MFTWTDQLTSITVTPFTETVGPTQPLPSTPLEVFRMFFTSAIMNIIVCQTNLYALQCMGEEKYDRWDKVTEQEMLAYFGFMILMGIFRLPSIHDYWKKDDTFNYSPIATRIPRDRFKEITRYLHFADNTTLVNPGSPGYDRLRKVRPILDCIAERFLNLYNPNCQCSIDEAMIPYKGRSSMKQYLPLKPTKRGFKVWVRADSLNGYVSEFQVYIGKQGNAEDGLGARVVKDLTNKLHNKYHHVYCDNFFTSFFLLNDLHKDGVYCCGTVRSNRKEFPSDLKKYKSSTRGEYITRQCENLTCSSWKDTKVVSIAATNSDPLESTEVNRKLRTGERLVVPCPTSIANYNKYMGGVDRNDQLREYYHLRLKSRKNYKYFFWFIVDVTLSNTYLLSKYDSHLKETYKNIKSFRVQLAKMLIGDYNSRKRRGRRTSLGVKRKRMTHFPKKSEDGKQHRCHYHTTYLKARKDTTWFCPDCQEYFCHNGRELPEVSL